MESLQQFDLERFITAQDRDFETALSEIKAGQKRNHWIWFIFPTVSWPGCSCESQYFAIPNLEAAKIYLASPYLHDNMLRICNALLELDETNPYVILRDDAFKLRSSMTLFELAAPDEPLFSAVLDKFFEGKRDSSILDLLNR